MTEFSEMVVIITGAANGQGAAEARLIASKGGCVVLTDIDEAGEDVAHSIGRNAAFIKHDVTSQADWSRVVAESISRFGQIDALVNNAGLFRTNPIQDAAPPEFETMYQVNQLGPFLGMKAVIPHMIERLEGSIVNVASIGGLGGFANEFSYCTSKWALRGMSRCAARDLSSFGIRVNSVMPGPIDTKMLGEYSADEKVSWAASVPLGRLGKAEEVAEAVAFLACKNSSFVTGAELVVDGGLMA